MPKQYAFLGRPVPRFTTRRLTILLFGLSVLALTLIATLTSAVPTPPSLSAYDPKISVPRIGDKFSKSILNPFHQPSHKPPRQKHDQFAGSSWWADWKWLSVPFSSSLTLDGDRALLPPLRERPPIYCYYDATTKKMREEKNAESALLLTWRRAWWGQGFWPVILSASEAMNNPNYDRLQRMDVDVDLKDDLMRWLAWERMGGGILSHYTLLPTVPREDALLTYLRRGEYPNLVRWKDLGSALLAGQESDIRKAIEGVLVSDKLKLKVVAEAVADGLFETDSSETPLANYSPENIAKNYSPVANSIDADRAKGLHSLNRLINGHLKVSWQNRFPDGIEIPNPLVNHGETITNSVERLAHTLVACPESPMPDSCPPNLPKCIPCSVDKPMNISTPLGYHNSSRIFTLGIVPHPWTLALLENSRDSLNISWIRRESPRDPWLKTLTKDFAGVGASESRRVVLFKDAVAGEHATAHSLWFAAEEDMPADLGWRFGFAISTPPADGITPQAPDPSDIARFERSKRVVSLTKSTDETKLRASLEAWSMADTEAWKFVRAFSSRMQLQRSKWEKGEEKYSHGAGTENGRTALNRWQDRKDE